VVKPKYRVAKSVKILKTYLINYKFVSYFLVVNKVINTLVTWEKRLEVVTIELLRSFKSLRTNPEWAAFVTLFSLLTE